MSKATIKKIPTSRKRQKAHKIKWAKWAKSLETPLNSPASEGFAHFAHFILCTPPRFFTVLRCCIVGCRTVGSRPICSKDSFPWGRVGKPLGR